MGLKQGIDASAYINVGTYNAPTWSELDLFSNVTPNGGWDAAEINIRRSLVKYGAKTNLDLGFTGKMLCDDSDANYVLMRQSWMSLTSTVDLLILDGPVTTVGSFGYRAEFQITAGGQDQPTTDVLYRDFAAVPYPTANKPKWAEVVAGPSVTFTDI